jgi:RNA polymerase sigma factor (sigma-70 family)
MDEATYTIIRSDREKGLKQLYQRYGRKLVGYALNNWSLTEDEAWELAYKTLYKVIEACATNDFVSEQKFSAFVFKVFLNYLRNHYRDVKKKQTTFVELKDTHVMVIPSAIAPVAQQNEKLKWLNEELKLLEDWQRILVLMRGQDIAYSVIAQYVDKPEEQLKVYYHRLRKMLAEKLAQRMNIKNSEDANV